VRIFVHGADAGVRSMGSTRELAWLGDYAASTGAACFTRIHVEERALHGVRRIREYSRVTKAVPGVTNRRPKRGSAAVPYTEGFETRLVRLDAELMAAPAQHAVDLTSGDAKAAGDE